MKKGRLTPTLFRYVENLLILALLIGNSAGSLAGRLARSLALAAAAGLHALGQVTSSNRLNTFHSRNLSNSQNFLMPGDCPTMHLS